MKKKLVIGILSAMLLTGSATAAYAATNPSFLDSFKAFHQQMYTQQSQFLQKQVEAGALSQDQADLMLKQMADREQYREQALQNGQMPNQGMGNGMRMGNGMGVSMGKGMHSGMFGLNNGQPLTEAQIKARDELRVQHQKLYNDAVINGTITPGQGFGRGMGGGNGMRGFLGN